MRRFGLTITSVTFVYALTGCVFTQKRTSQPTLPDPGGPVALKPLSPNAPIDKVAKITPDLEEKLAELTKQARKSLPEVEAKFHAGLPKGQVLFVVTPLFDEHGKRENVFVQVEKWQNGIIHGGVASEMEIVRTVKAGDPITVKESDVMDWSISRPDGTEEGNFIGKYLETVKQ